MGSCGENHDALVTMAILTMALLYYGAHAAGALVGAQSLLTQYSILVLRQALHLWRLQPNLDKAPLERLHALVGSLSLGTADE